MKPEEVEQRIQSHIPQATASVSDLTGTGDHFQAEVVSPSFEGKTRIEQHQMVYAALGDWMKGPIHALKLTTKSK